MNRYAVYNISTGSIDRIYSGAAWEALLQAQPGEGVVGIADGLDDATAYIDANTTQPVAKQPFAFTITKTQIVADGVDVVSISNVPAGTQITWPDGQSDVTNGDLVEFAVDLPGTYTLKFTAVAYLDKEITIEAIPAA
jgi:hypothetical protein